MPNKDSISKMKQFWLALGLSAFSNLVSVNPDSHTWWLQLKEVALQKLAHKIERQTFYINTLAQDIDFWEQRCASHPNSEFCEMLALLCYMRQQELQKLQQRQARYCNLTGKCANYVQK